MSATDHNTYVVLLFLAKEIQVSYIPCWVDGNIVCNLQEMAAVRWYVEEQKILESFPNFQAIYKLQTSTNFFSLIRKQLPSPS